MRKRFVLISILLPLVSLLLFWHTFSCSVQAKPPMIDVGGSITSDTTWTFANSPYILTDTVTIEAGVTLTVEAGVTIMVPDMGEYLDVQGHLEAVGTAVNPILFTSIDDLASNNWSGIAVSGSANFAHATLRHAYTALFISGSIGGDVSLADSVVEENLVYPIVVNTDALHRLKMDNVTFSNNVPNRVGIETASGNLALAGSPTLEPQPGLEGYEELNTDIPTVFTVPEGITLTLEPGTNLMMLSTVQVAGHVAANGTATDPVIWQAVPESAGGVFSVIVLPAGTVAFNQTTLKGSPTLGLAVVGESDRPIIIQNSTLEDMGDYPMLIVPPSLHRVEMNNLTFSNNAFNRVLVDTEGGQDAIVADVKLTAQPGLEWYEFADGSSSQTPPAQFVVPEGITLTVEPGVELRFGDGAEEFVVNGSLFTRGSLAQPVTLTSGSNATAGDWLGLIINGEVDLVNTAVRFGNHNLTINNTADALLENVTLTQAEFAGLRVVGGMVTAVRSQFAQNGTDGILVENNGAPAVSISSSGISSNGSTGLRNLSGTLVEAEGNWWGDASGPSGDGSGSGDGVEGDVNFSSWLTDELWTMLHYELYLPSIILP
ncbi:hypothetical protein [Candidatus Leptofilum sp.]|uniref:hypothetical protein n=1 Tax=Candidatus Leptofilum sp. TaxID=3241576 RepID=UPI003B5AA94D